MGLKVSCEVSSLRIVIEPGLALPAGLKCENWLAIIGGGNFRTGRDRERKVSELNYWFDCML